MRNYKIGVNELIIFQSNEKVLFASDSKEDKQLYCNLRGSYEVWHKKKKVYECIQPYQAVEKYNSL
jgi:hypothetical protein